MDTFDYKRLVALVKRINDFGEFLRNKGTLLFIALQRDPILARVVPVLQRYRIAGFIGGAEQCWVFGFLQEVTHDVPHRVRRQDSGDAKSCAEERS